MRAFTVTYQMSSPEIAIHKKQRYEKGSSKEKP
jgi:hypothetical protein